MPIYEYRCEDCGHIFEEMLLGSDKDPETCPKCAKSSVGRIMSSTNFQLKGTGWYVTDYKNDASSGQSTASPDPTPKESTDGAVDPPSAASAETSSEAPASSTASDTSAT